MPFTDREKLHGPAAYAMLYVGAIAKFVFSSLSEKNQIVCGSKPSELAETLVPVYGEIVRDEFEGKMLKVNSISRMKTINSAVVDMVRRELEQFPQFSEKRLKSGFTTVERMPLVESSPDSLKHLWQFLGFIEACVDEKFVLKRCKAYCPKDKAWKPVLEKLCSIANASGNKAGKDNTASLERMRDMPGVFETIFGLIVGSKNVPEYRTKINLGDLSAALRATAIGRDVENLFQDQKIHGPYFVYRRARSSVTNQKTDIDIIVRDFIWLLPMHTNASRHGKSVRGYYFSAFDEEIYEIYGIVETEGEPSILKVDAEAIRTHQSNKLLSLYVPTIAFGKSDIFTLGTVVGSLRDTQRTGGWSCVVVRPELDAFENHALNTVVYSFYRLLEKHGGNYGSEIDRLREIFESIGLVGVYTSRILEIDHKACEPGLSQYVKTQACASDRRKDIMACLCHDKKRHESVRLFVKTLMKKHELEVPVSPSSPDTPYKERAEAALLEAVLENIMSATVPTTGLGEISEILARSNGDGVVYGSDGAEVVQGTTELHDAVVLRLSNGTYRRTLPMKKYAEFTKPLRASA